MKGENELSKIWKEFTEQYEQYNNDEIIADDHHDVEHKDDGVEYDNEEIEYVDDDVEFYWQIKITSGCKA